MEIIDRHQFLQWTGAAMVAMVGLPLAPLIKPRALWGASREPGFEPDVDTCLEAASRQVPLLHGSATNVWTYQDKMLTGLADALDLKAHPLGALHACRRRQQVRPAALVFGDVAYAGRHQRPYIHHGGRRPG